MVVRCGEWNMDTKKDTIRQDRWAHSIHRHPNFKFAKRNIPQNDFALIRVKKDFDLNQYVDTICLPNRKDDYDLTGCYATGYGKDRWGR